MSDVDDYIRDNASTMSREEIVTHLHAAGYNLKEIDAAWRRSRGFPSCAPTSPAPARRALGLPRLAFGILAALAVVFIAVGVLGLLPFDVAPLAWAAFPYVGLGILAIVARSLIRFARGDRRAFRGYWVWLNTAGLTAWLVRGGQADWLPGATSSGQGR